MISILTTASSALMVSPSARVHARAPPIVSSIAVFGASGGTGSEVVMQSLMNGERVSALVREKRKLQAPRTIANFRQDLPTSGTDLVHFRQGSMDNMCEMDTKDGYLKDRLKVTAGSVTNQADVDKVFEGEDITGVIVALGGKTKDVGPTMLQEGTANIVAACQANGIKRIAVVSTIGAGDSMDQASWGFKLLMNTVMKTVMEDKNKQEALFAPGGPGSDLEFCIIRPGGLKSEEPSGVVNVIDGEAGPISRADVAAFLLDAICEPDFKYVRKSICISSDKGSGFDSVLADKTKSRMGK
jgi:putative NADH-flavin reductase